MIARIRAGSLTRLSLSAIGLCVPDSASVFGSVTVHPLEEKVAGPLFEEQGRTVVAVRLRVDCQEP
jgi:hypothetical protein